MRKIAFTVLFGLLTGLCFSQQTLVVPPVYDRGAGLNAGDLATMTDLIINAIQRQDRFDVPDREALALMTEEHRFQISDWSDDVKSIQMGKVMNANYLARCIIAPLDGTVNLLQIRILDVNTARIVGRAQELEFSTLRDLRGKLDGFLHGITGGITTEKTSAVVPTYQIGDRGPAGGWVFYDKGVVSNGWRYLEAAPAGTEFRARWRVSIESIAIATIIPREIGTGKRNTDLIAASLRRRGERGTAAQLAAELTVGASNAYDDWFLPSWDELDLMYQNLKQKGLGGFSNTWYWSSTKIRDDSSYGQDFGDGTRDSKDDIITGLVRCVRAF
jgi:hypothetical protein